MGWSPLATETHNTRQYSNRTTPANMVVLHHGATTNADGIIQMETTGSKQVSSHLVVKDSRRAGIVQEQFRAWSLSDAYWDSRSFTVECANESTNGWTISDASHESLAMLVADWARRYNFWPHRDGNDETWTVIGHREVYTIHGGSYGTACPGGMDLDRITRRAQQILLGDDDFLSELTPAEQRNAYNSIVFAANQMNGWVADDRTAEGQLATMIHRVDEILAAVSAVPGIQWETGKPVLRPLASFLQNPPSPTLSTAQIAELGKQIAAGIKIPTGVTRADVQAAIDSSLAKIFKIG